MSDDAAQTRARERPGHDRWPVAYGRGELGDPDRATHREVEDAGVVMERHESQLAVADRRAEELVEIGVDSRIGIDGERRDALGLDRDGDLADARHRERRARIATGWRHATDADARSDGRSSTPTTPVPRATADARKRRSAVPCNTLGVCKLDVGTDTSPCARLHTRPASRSLAATNSARRNAGSPFTADADSSRNAARASSGSTRSPVP